METYKQKVRAFLYEPENFEILWELYDFIAPSRKELFSKLVSEFLTELEKELSVAFPSSDWRTKLHIKDCGDYPGVWLYKDEWQGFFDIRLQFGIGKYEAWYGLVREIKERPDLKENTRVEELVDSFAGVEQGFEPRDDWWLTWKYIGYFSDVEEVKKLLPSARSVLIEEYANTVRSFANDIGPRIPELVECVEPWMSFQEIVDIYNTLAETGYKAVGNARDWRWIKNEGWPSGVHYELVDEGVGGLGLEIHLEADEVKSLAEILISFKDPFISLFPEAEVLWDPTYMQGRGRLQVRFERGTDAGMLAEAMKTIIKETFPAIDKVLKTG
jgi:hypothetical protein